MRRKKEIVILKILTIITFFAMIFVNSLANALPLNGVNTGEVSDSYKNLFAPTGLTFSIWGLIYLLLAGYILYINFFQGNIRVRDELILKTGLLFSVSSLANTLWIFSWHYYIIPLSFILMIIILICLILLTKNIRRQKLTVKQKIFIKLPFSVYFGWITVATIANATALLVSLKWSGFGISEQVWTIIIIIVGMLIGVATTVINKDVAYGLVIIWAYMGIVIKHLSESGFSSQYPSIIIAATVSIVLILLAIIYVIFAKRQIANLD